MDSWESKMAVLEALNAYSGAAARLDIEAFMAFFVDDAEVHGIAGLLGQPEPLVGHAQIAAFFERSFANLEWLQQQNTTTDVVFSEDGAAAKTSTGLVEMAGRKGAAGMVVLIARYDDELVLSESGWRFRKRVLTPYRFVNEA